MATASPGTAPQSVIASGLAIHAAGSSAGSSAGTLAGSFSGAPVVLAAPAHPSDRLVASRSSGAASGPQGVAAGGSAAGASKPDDGAPKSAPTAHPLRGQIVITEIMYNPASDESRGEPEWVEIANLGTTTVELSGWRLDDEDTLPMEQWGPFSCVLGPGEVAVLVHRNVEEEEFRAAWDDPESPVSYQVIRVKWGGLANTPSETNEILRLRDGAGEIVCEVNFRNGDGWPKLTALGGPSIYLVDLDATDLSSGAHWRASKAGEHGAIERKPTRVFGGKDIGSPGRLPPRHGQLTASGAGASDATEGATTTGERVE